LNIATQGEQQYPRVVGFKFSIGCHIPLMNILIVITTFVSNFGSKDLIHYIEDTVKDK
jgi:hypothetical protein